MAVENDGRTTYREIPTLPDINELVTTPSQHIAVAVSTDGKWADFIFIAKGMLTRDANILKDEIDKRVDKYVEQHAGQTVNFVHGKTLTGVLSSAESLGVKVPSLLARQINFVLKQGFGGSPVRKGLLSRLFKKGESGGRVDEYGISVESRGRREDNPFLKNSGWRPHRYDQP